MFNVKKSLIALFAVLTVCGVEARADTFVIPDVQGDVYITTSLWGGPPTLRLGPMFSLSGPGLSVFAQSHPSGDAGSVEVRDICMVLPGCTPGRVIETNSSFSGLIASQSFAGARVNGVLYDMVRVTGWLNFTSEPIVVPNFGLTPYVVTIPFTFSGQLTGTAFQPDVVNPVFTAMLTGQGEASFHFVLVGFDLLNPRYRLDYLEYRFGPPIPISIDIKPATSLNSINPRSKGKIPVAILTTLSFDATAVDPTTVLFGATGIEIAPVQSAMEDVDGDGDVDMVLHFVTQDTGITCGNSSASLTGAMFSGVKIKGSDSIETVGCN